MTYGSVKEAFSCNLCNFFYYTCAIVYNNFFRVHYFNIKSKDKFLNSINLNKKLKKRAHFALFDLVIF